MSRTGLIAVSAALCVGLLGVIALAEDAPDLSPLLTTVERIGETCGGDPADVTVRLGDAAVFVSCMDATTVTLVGTIGLQTCGAIASALFGADLGKAFVASGGAPARAEKGEIIRTFGLCEATVRLRTEEGG